MPSKKKKPIKIPSVYNAIFGKPRPVLFPDLDTSTKEGYNEYHRRYEKLLRDQTRKRKYSPRKRKQ